MTFGAILIPRSAACVALSMRGSLIASNLETSGVHVIGMRQRSPDFDCFIFSIIAGHQRIKSAARPYLVSPLNAGGGKKEINPLSVYAIRSGQCCRMAWSPETI